ncbi:hypothetical protein J1C51_23545 [Chromobacterium haemolyticum]|uniref:hypothetical protein n=1 Tax=Chromobacterium haemolyticum TaxID=394935 RepID=UPI001A91FBA8|nr:hypothetical protein [Chromobacterium haemolyticum]MBO0501752.1 hypothetical protein [Chromobacterium haemolyticum]
MGITHPILSVDPLASIYDCAPWEPWAAELAAERFHAELTALVAARHTTALPL